MLALHYYKSFFEQKSYELIAFQDEASFRSKFIDVLHRESKKQLRYLANIICDEHLAMKIILEKLLEHKGEYIFVGITYEGKFRTAMRRATALTTMTSSSLTGSGHTSSCSRTLNMCHRTRP